MYSSQKRGGACGTKQSRQPNPMTVKILKEELNAVKRSENHDKEIDKKASSSLKVRGPWQSVPRQAMQIK